MEQDLYAPNLHSPIDFNCQRSFNGGRDEGSLFPAKTRFFENNRGQFLIKDDLNKLDSTDVWLFVDFPGLKTSSQVLQRLRTSWEKNHQNVFLMLGPRFNATKLQQK